MEDLCLPSSVLGPLWVQFAALLTTGQVHYQIGCTVGVSPTG
jgi:hypothetical protein